MTSDPAEPTAADDDVRDPAHVARRRWADEVQRALSEKNLSSNAAAKAIGISPGRLQAWLKQDVEPSPRVMRDLAHVIGRGHTHLLQLLDWLPTEMSDAPLRLEATERLNESMAEARRWLQGAVQASGLGGGSLVAGALLEAGNDWHATLRNSLRGRRHRVRYAVRIGLSRSAGEPAYTADDGRTATDRYEIERLVLDTMLRASARWLPADRLAGAGWAVRPDLVLAVPALCASRPRGLRPNMLVPPSVVVVGSQFTGSQEVAAFLADLLDWAYIDVAGLAAEQFGLGQDSAPEVVTRAQAMTARRMIQNPGAVARQTVWSYSDPKPIRQTFQEIGPELPLVVLLRAPDSVLAYLGTRPADGDDSPAVLAETAQNMVRRTLTGSRAESDYLVLDVPDLPIGKRSPDEIDMVFDNYVELAFQAAQWLHDRHGAPALSESPGILGGLWRANS